MTQARECLEYDILPQLKKNGIYILDYAELSGRQKASMNRYFEDVIFPVLTPLAHDPATRSRTFPT